MQRPASILACKGTHHSIYRSESQNHTKSTQAGQGRTCCITDGAEARRLCQTGLRGVASSSHGGHGRLAGWACIWNFALLHIFILIDVCCFIPALRPIHLTPAAVQARLYATYQTCPLLDLCHLCQFLLQACKTGPDIQRCRKLKELSTEQVRWLLCAHCLPRRRRSRSRRALRGRRALAAVALPSWDCSAAASLPSAAPFT